MADDAEAAQAVTGVSTSVEGTVAGKEGLKFRDYLDGSLNNKVPWILEGLLAEREQLLIFGAPKVGKSQFALQLAVAVATGKGFLRWENPRKEPRRVIYVNFEIDEHPFMNRLADHVMAECEPNWKRCPEAPELGQEVIDRVNKEIQGCFFFSDGIRSLELTDTMLKADSSQNGDQKEKSLPLVEEWRAKITAFKPDLIVFDTLSKMHKINESDNNPIQQIMMMIRRIATTLPMDDEPLERAVAHVIVHHSRKNNEFGRPSFYVPLDGIRGGSAIRAEADVILGLGGVDHYADDDPDGEANRGLVLEARNVAAARFALEFNGTRFTPAKEESKTSMPVGDFEKTIKTVMLKHGVQGITAKKLTDLIGGKKAGKKRLAWIRENVDNYVALGTNLLLIQGDETDRYRNAGPMFARSANATDFLWIPEGSKWLEDARMRNAIQKWQTSGSANVGFSKSKSAFPARKRGRPKKIRVLEKQLDGSNGQKNDHQVIATP